MAYGERAEAHTSPAWLNQAPPGLRLIGLESPLRSAMFEFYRWKST